MLVLANEMLVPASNTSHTDLFRLLQGGGPSFGPMTALTVPAPLMPVNYANEDILVVQMGSRLGEFAQVDHDGSKNVISVVSPDATAFVHRDTFLSALEMDPHMHDLTMFINQPAYC
ncbi:hypothetical protein JB92DRAFT_3122077 [Gautieria morchelliformis]|nr:hypothetical protein JB92DRAFT_3122077 [Gautieria morchelliformis]